MEWKKNMEKSISILAEIQNELKVPKLQMNEFGGYKYRSCGDILEAVKPICAKYGCALILTDNVEIVGDRFYVIATAKLINQDGAVIGETKAFARETVSRKGMDEAQVTGASSSYARKYALSGLFAIDDTRDADTMEAEKTEEENADTMEAEKTEKENADTMEAEKTEKENNVSAIADAINSAKTVDELMKIYNENKNLSKEILPILKNKKKELENGKAE